MLHVVQVLYYLLRTHGNATMQHRLNIEYKWYVSSKAVHTIGSVHTIDSSIRCRVAEMRGQTRKSLAAVPDVEIG